MEPRDIMDNEEIIPSEEVPQQTAEPITEILTPIEPVMQEPVSTEPAVEEETSAEPIVQEQTPVEAIVQEQIPAQPVVQAAQPVISEQPAPSAPTYQPKSTTYHGAGVGHKESPYANSPYYSPYNPQPSGSGTYIPPQQTPPPVKKQPKVKKRRKLSPRGKSILAAVLAVVILVVSCAATASVVNGRWEKKLDALQQQMDDQFAHLQQQIEQVNTSGGGMIGIPVESGALTPGQVYAKNVYSVVGISNYAEFSSGWGESTTQLAGTGSGFIISEDGYAITNYHVVEGASYLTVTTYTGEEYEATLVGHDQLNDVALLKVDASGLTL